MPPVAISHLWINPGRQKPAAYFRRGKLLVRVRDAAGKPLLPGDSGFLAAFGTIQDKYTRPVAEAPTGPAKDTLAALVAAYRGSPEWAGRAPATRTNYDKSLTPLATNFGDYPVADIPRSFVFNLRDHYATDADGKPTPRRANAMVGVLRLLLKWGVDRGWRKDNPATDPGQLQTGPGLATWRPADFERFMACVEVGEPLHRAAALGYYTGQRKQDCLSATHAARAGGEIEFQPAKTKRSTAQKVYVPEHPELTRILDAAPRTDSVTILTRQDGRPWKEDHFNHAFAAAVRVAGLPDGHGFHGLRKAMSVNLAALGATDAELDAIVYHSDPSMSRMYRRDANNRELAKSAMAKLVKGKV